MNNSSADSDHLSPVSYDELPYPSLSYAQSHPDRLATMATLLGLEPAPVDRCRLLDIGCAVGGNIIPMAFNLPESQFVGVDYARRQIETGRDYVAELGLRNIRLEHLDIMAMPEELGQFDYIIAHGFYSWAPPAVRDQLLAVIRRHLAPAGIAYVSYNTYPGWHMLQVVRDIMLYRARDLEEPSQRADAGREIIDFLANAIPADAGPFGSFLNSYRGTLASKLAEGPDGGDSLLLHDEMAEINEPVYVEQFVDHAAQHGLQYLSEVDLSTSMPSRLPPKVARQLGEMARYPMEAEQILDYINFRTFRQSLLCHQEVKVNKRLRPQIVSRFMLTSLAEPESEAPDLQPGVVEHFRGGEEALFSTDHPLSKAALLYLVERKPAAIPFGDLVRAAAGRINLPLDQAAEGEIATFAANALRALSYSPGLIEFHVYQSPFTLTVSERPATTPLIRWQAQKGMKATSLRHERVDLDPMARVLLPLLDGQHDQTFLLDFLMSLYRDGKVTLLDDSIESAGAQAILARQMELTLRFMARAALLVG